MLTPRTLVAVAVAALVLSGCASLQAPPEKLALQSELALAATYEGPPDEWLHARRMAGSAVSLKQIRNAGEAAERMRLLAAAQGAATAGAGRSTRGGVSWQFNGPTEIGGRILDIAVDPVTADTLYVAAASGGVWRSTDAGMTYSSIWPDGFSQAIGALAITADGSKLYAGTGESGPGGGSFTYGNKGVFVTTDGGASWTNLGLAATERISRVVLDPSDENRIFVAATGPLYAPSPDRGVYRSTDAGATWQLVLPGDNLRSGASDVWIDPNNPNRLYAVMWEHSREPARRLYGGVGSGIFRSDDGGDTWTRLAGGLPAASADVGRIGLALAPSNPNRLYAIYNDTVGFFDGFYSSIDGGDTWTLQPPNTLLSGSQSSFGWWFARIWVDPALETRLFVAGVSLMESVTAGLGWSQSPGVHADQHAMAWDPNVSGRVYLGNDGGMYRSDTNAVVGSWVSATSQPWTQFYTLDVGEQDPTRVVGGTQDNGCNRSYSATGPGWNSYGCGDGLETLINPVDQNIVFGCSQYGSCSRSTNGGETTSSIGSTTSQRRNWLTPLVFDPNDPSIMYYAGNILNRSTVGGAGGWTAISPSLPGPDPFPGSDEPYPFGTITTVAPAASDGQTLYVGTDDARVWYTHDLGANWNQSTDPDLPNRWVSRIVVDPSDADVAYLTYSGFRNGDDTPYVFKTVDGGVNWDDITSNLPPAPVNGIALYNESLIVINDAGVYISDNDGASWSFLGSGLPNVPVMDLRVHAPTNTLHVATFGRGMWKIEVPQPDFDDDGVVNSADNCTEVFNPSQCDTNGDFYGNHCDADLDNNGITNSFDLQIMRDNFGAVGVNDADLDCNNIVNTFDLQIMRARFGLAPGPSGTAP